MADIGDSPTTNNLDRDVVVHVARRMARDADFAYLAGFGTDLFERVERAQIASTGLDKEVVRQSLSYRGREKPRAAELAARVRELESILDARCPEWRRRAEDDDD